jgi:hypothetical protein
MRQNRFVFVGERRSRRAIAIGARWENGRLCARTLHEALCAMGLDPGCQVFVNAYTDSDPAACSTSTTGAQRDSVGVSHSQTLPRLEHLYYTGGDG